MMVLALCVEGNGCTHIQRIEFPCPHLQIVCV
uniref:Uncharacterized protein n=1 Tax=Rhizophora mucronata TaxID=61149 RepID=A0A2P2P081_RHIMU